MSSDARPKVRRIGPDATFRDTTELARKMLAAPEMGDFEAPGAMLLWGWINS